MESPLPRVAAAHDVQLCSLGQRSGLLHLGNLEKGAR
jgi:hypothetical protein